MDHISVKKNEITIAKAMKKDLKDIMEIELICFKDAWVKDFFVKDFENEENYYVCALYNKKVVGYAGYILIYDEGHITKVAVEPLFQNNKIANMLIEKLIDEAEKRNLNSLTLEVRRSNLYAFRLYSGLGFDVVGERKDYYIYPKEDALIMTKTLREAKQ